MLPQLRGETINQKRVKFSRLQSISSNVDIHSRGAKIVVASLLVGMAAFSPMFGASDPSKLADMSLEDLMQVEVTTVSKHKQKLSETAAAVFVLTQEDIRRSGLNSIPDLLRLVPGLDVAQVTSNSWAVSARGFNGIFANKMLVLVDGRTVYSPFFSGVYWDVQDTLIEDIDRIEVIRGPGATTWGANAVNGVINIITKNTAETRGTLVTTEVGVNDQNSLAVRHGGALGEHGNYRAFLKYDDNPSFLNLNGTQANDGWNSVRVGARGDWVFTNSTLMVESDLYSESSQLRLDLPLLTPPYASITSHSEHPFGGDVVVNWTKKFSTRSSIDVRAYVDGWSRPSNAKEFLKSIDFDFQQHYTLNEQDDFSWGGGVRDTVSGYSGSLIIEKNLQFTNRLLNVFLSDEHTLIPNRLVLTIGSRFEWVGIGEMETQPSIRTSWSLDKQNELWAAVSRAVRTPSWGQRAADTPVAAFPTAEGIPTLLTVIGNPTSRSEDLLSYETGYRWQPATVFSVDLAGFYGIYHHLMTADLMNPTVEQSGGQPYLLLPALVGNKLDAKSRGAELSANWQPRKKVKFNGSYSRLDVSSRHYASSNDISGDGSQNSSPHNQFNIQSSLAVSRKTEWDTTWNYVEGLPTLGLPGYSRIDMHIAWHVNSSLELAAGARNLTGRKGLEQNIDSEFFVADQNPGKRLYVKLSWRI